MTLFEKLGFEILNEIHEDHAILTDGTILIKLDYNNEFGKGVEYLTEDIIAVKKYLEEKKIAFEKRETNNTLLSIQFVDPNNVTITVSHALLGDFPLLEEKPTSKLGRFSELSIVTDDFEKTINFWKILGFRISFGNKEKDNNISMTDNNLIIDWNL